MESLSKKSLGTSALNHHDMPKRSQRSLNTLRKKRRFLAKNMGE